MDSYYVTEECFSYRHTIAELLEKQSTVFLIFTDFYRSKRIHVKIGITKKMSDTIRVLDIPNITIVRFDPDSESELMTDFFDEERCEWYLLDRFYFYF